MTPAIEPEVAEVRAHSEWGASIAKKRIECPGSKLLDRKCPRQAATFYTAEGTAAHAVADGILKHRLGREEYTPPAEMEVDGFTITVSDEMIGHCNAYADYVLGLQTKYNILPEHVYTETKVHIPCDVTEEFWGTADAMLYAPFQRLIAIDFKYGAGVPVDVKKNAQLMFYGLGGWYALPEDERDEIVTVQTAVFQPRIDDGYIGTVDNPIGDLLEFKDQLREAFILSDNPEPVLKVGDHCRWCPAKLICPAKKASMHEIGLVVETAAFKPIMPKPGELSIQQLLDLKSRREEADAFFDAVDARLFALAMSGTDIPEHHIVESKSKRLWIDEKAVVEAYSKRLGDKLYKKTIVSPKQVEDLLSLKKKEDKEALNALTKRVVTGKTLQKKKPGVKGIKVGPEADFIDVEATFV